MEKANLRKYFHIAHEVTWNLIKKFPEALKNAAPNVGENLRHSLKSASAWAWNGIKRNVPLVLLTVAGLSPSQRMNAQYQAGQTVRLPGGLTGTIVRSSTQQDPRSQQSNITWNQAAQYSRTQTPQAIARRDGQRLADERSATYDQIRRSNDIIRTITDERITAVDFANDLLRSGDFVLDEKVNDNLSNENTCCILRDRYADTEYNYDCYIILSKPIRAANGELTYMKRSDHATLFSQKTGGNNVIWCSDARYAHSAHFSPLGGLRISRAGSVQNNGRYGPRPIRRGRGWY